MERVVEESLKLPARVLRAVMTGMLAPDAQARLSKIKAPTLILWGEQDTLFPRAEQNSLASAIPSAVLQVYPQTGHSLHWERPEQFVKDLENFMSRTEPR